MNEEATTTTWVGPDVLAPFLQPIDELRESEENARKGDVLALVGSLRRWGQVRPILATPDGVIVAGHHLRLAAIELGWTHIAVIPNEFSDDDERHAYLIADNQLSCLGGYDEQKRAEQMSFLDELAQQGKLEGTGFTPDSIDDERARWNATPEAAPADPSERKHSESADEAAERAAALAQGHRRKEAVLSLTLEQHERFGLAVAEMKAQYKERYGDLSVTDTIYLTVLEAAGIDPELEVNVPEVHHDQMTIA